MKKTNTAPRRPLVIVESPNKVKTISRILGDEYNVQASYGHFADIPAKKGAVDVDNGYVATYGLTSHGKEIIAKLKREMETASEVILATDDDREGEMIAALLVEFLQPAVPVSRIAFRAITKFEILNALENRREVSATMVEAARARRYLDHLYGFEVSPVLWGNVRQNLGIGRVKGPALRLLVEREEARLAFVRTDYCGIEATLASGDGIVAELRAVDGVPVARSADIDDVGKVAPPAELLLMPLARELEAALAGARATVTDVKNTAYTRRAPRPYTTTDLLADIVNRTSMGAGAAQGVMNQLHEKGLISYPRTDSPALSPVTTESARQQAVAMFGHGIVPAKPNRFFPRRKTAQEAHEAIRPSDMTLRHPKGLSPQQALVYELVWRRTVASQMIDATGTTTSVTFTVVTDDPSHTCTFVASGTSVTEPGHMRITHPDNEHPPTSLAKLATGSDIDVASVEVSAHSTKPPARFTVPTLIRALEELEVGRPSTYATIIEELRREYVWSKQGDKALIPTLTAVAVHRFMIGCLPALVDDAFTREMEMQLNDIVDGSLTLPDMLDQFYARGRGGWPGLVTAIGNVKATYRPAEHPVMIVGLHPDSGDPIVLKPGKSFTTRKKANAARGKRRPVSTGSPYLNCGSRNVRVPDQTELADLTVEFALQLLNAPDTARVLGEHGGEQVEVKSGPYGPYVRVGKRNVSIPASLDAGTITLDDAIGLLAYPRTLGTHEGTEVVLKHGRYGFYVDRDGDTRPLGADADPSGFTLEDALELLSRPKKGRGKR